MTTVLEKHTEESTSRFATVDSIRLHYHEAGEGEALVMLHGAGPGASGWSNYWQNVEELSKSYRVILLDQPGYGKTDKVIPENEARSEFSARLLVGLLDQLGIDKAHMVGNSFGGRTSLVMALRYPDRVGRLVMMGPAGGSLNIFMPEPTEGMKLLHGFFKEPGPSREKMRQIVDTFLYNKELATDALVDSRYAVAVEPETRKFYEHFLSTPDKREPELWRELEKIKHRTLLVWGRDDRTNPFEGGLFMLKRMPDARLHVIPQCGHWVQYEKCDEFNAILTSFIEAA
ncbi:alpha/beta fold hydrolase [Maritimibacter sp. UBA3975]|uniref:alpha/beta fold hydrolase n=1 Tax=Maritimibacter sp. UBA3975 TaxID=1946833 RepID=UPI0025C6EC51|nr:alpha/beta fold hydrolase [Maritimibacter sp. UBA3975]